VAKRRIVWASTARIDLEEIVSYIVEDDIDQALAAVRRLQSRCIKLGEFPERGRVVPELRRVDVLNYRELIEKPWRIIYRFEVSCVYVVAVLDGRRNLTSLLLERLSR
jgi:toxin ParE1/3/4